MKATNKMNFDEYQAYSREQMMHRQNNILSEQLINISKAAAYDIVSKQVQELTEELGLEKIHSQHQTTCLESCEFALQYRNEKFDELAVENNKLRNRVKELENLIDEYTGKMLTNLSGEKSTEAGDVGTHIYNHKQP